MKQCKQTYSEPLTTIVEVESEGFICDSIQRVMMHVEVDEYETYDEINLDVL